MALFKRKKNESALPEVDQYYQAEKRDRSGLAWLLALLSIAVIAGVIVLVFLAGRWAYNEITQDEQSGEVATSDQVNAPSFDNAPSTGETSDESGSENAPAEGENTEGNTDEDEEQPASPTSPANPTSPAETPRTGSNELPSTGPANIVAIFAGVSLAAGGAHYALNSRKPRR